MASVLTENSSAVGFQVNQPPSGFDRRRDLPAGFIEFFTPLHVRFAPRQQALLEERKRVLAESLQGNKPTHRFPAGAVRNGWRVELPEWCQDQRNQMTGP